jgi:catalase
MLQGRSLSYSDTQRYRVGPNYLQLPINRPKTHVATNQRDGQMAYHVDGVEAGENPHVNYEPSSLGGLKEAVPAGKPHSPHYEANLVRQKISRTNDFQQAGERWRAFEAWERDELVFNLVDALKDCPKDIQQRMISNFTQADADYGRRVTEGIATAAAGMSSNGQGPMKAGGEKMAAKS